MNNEQTDELSIEEIKMVAELEGYQVKEPKEIGQLVHEDNVPDNIWSTAWLNSYDFPIDHNLVARLREKLLTSNELWTQFTQTLLPLVHSPTSENWTVFRRISSASPAQQCRALLKVFEEEESAADKWLLRMAEKEDNHIISVGGLVTRIAQEERNRERKSF